MEENSETKSNPMLGKQYSAVDPKLTFDKDSWVVSALKGKKPDHGLLA